jgi:hypothetical protein
MEIVNPRRRLANKSCGLRRKWRTRQIISRAGLPGMSGQIQCGLVGHDRSFVPVEAHARHIGDMQ